MLNDNNASFHEVNRGPIFLIGAPRSGTTLLRVMLDRHPSVHICNETYYFYYVYERRKAFGNLSDAGNRLRLIGQYMETRRGGGLGLEPRLSRDILMAEGHTYRDFFRTVLRLAAESQGKTRWGEKTPQHAFHSEVLCSWFPDSTLIHLVRDPRDVVSSLRRMPWAPNNVVANTRIWLRHVAAAMRCETLPNYVLVRYEDLVADPERVLRHVCERIGEPYSSSMLASDGTPAEGKEWWFRRAYQGVTPNRVNKWRESLSEKETSIVEWLAGPQMEQFGYSCSGPPASNRVKIGVLAAAAAESGRERIRNLPRLWYQWLRPAAIAREESWNDRRTVKTRDLAVV